MNTKTQAVKTAPKSDLRISMDLQDLENMGIHVHLSLNSLELFVEGKYDQHFVNFLERMPPHLSDDEKSRLTVAVDSAYTSIMIQRCFDTAGKLTRTA